MNLFAMLGHRATKARAIERWERDLLSVLPNDTIPKMVHQVYLHGPLPENLALGITHDQVENPTWDYHLYTASDIETFIASEYGPRVLEVYQSIRPVYGAARVDLFRYLLIYRVGGAYLDIKSRFERPIDSVISGDEGYILSQWANGPGEQNEGIGLGPDLNGIQGGEYQQWHVIASPGHPFLRAVLVRILAAIENYTPWRTNVGRIGVVRLTGPIPYTRAIEPILALHRHRFFRSNSELGLIYSAYVREDIFRARHYSELTNPIVEKGPFSVASGWMFQRALALQQRLRKLQASDYKPAWPRQLRKTRLH